MFPLDPGRPVADWKPCPPCFAPTVSGQFVHIEPFDADCHAEALWQSFGGVELNARIFWFAWPALHSASDLADQLGKLKKLKGWSTAVLMTGGVPAGMASFMREDAANGSVEIGAVAHSESLARTAASTEAHYLLMQQAFSLGYRRYEWKCDSANSASIRAARRLGFSKEGVFRNHSVRRGHNRDTMWFSIIDEEWPAIEREFKRWLHPDNFDKAGSQRTPLRMKP